MPNLLNPTKRRPKFIAMALPIVGIAILGYTGNVLLTAGASKVPAQETAGYPATVQTSDCCRIKVNSAKRSDAGSDRLTVNVTTENISNGTIQYSPDQQVTLKDKKGY